MARGINKVILVGNLGADPETRYTANGQAVTNIRLATTRSWRDRQSGEQQEQTEWHRVVFFGRTAEVAGEYLKKGRQVYIEGRLQTREWEDREGNKRWTTEIVADEMQMLGGRDGGGSASYEPSGGGQRSQGDQSGDQKSSGGTRESAPSDDFEDDIPF